MNVAVFPSKILVQFADGRAPSLKFGEDEASQPVELDGTPTLLIGGYAACQLRIAGWVNSLLCYSIPILGLLIDIRQDELA
jgi:hypothetical protein